MKKIIILCLFIYGAYADELDIFDAVDATQSSFEVEEKLLDMELKLSYQYNDARDDDKYLFFNLKKDAKNYALDARVIANDDNQSFLIKELYYKDTFFDHHISVGRMNIKNGVATAYNPTDYFRSNASLTLSSDPKEQKDNRLGSLAIRDVMFIDSFTIKNIFVPRVSAGDDSFLTNKEYIGLHLDSTNELQSINLYVDYSGFKDTSLALTLHKNDEESDIGLNLSYIYSALIIYSESSLRKFEDGFYETYDNLLEDVEFVYETVFGLSYTNELNIVTSIEYIFNSGGLDEDGWKSFFNRQKNPLTAPKMGAMRGEFAKKGVALSRETLFLLSRSSDVVTNLDLNAMMWLNPYDKSALTQVGGSYALSDTIETIINYKHYFGDASSEYGSMFNTNEVLVEFQYFF